jgi:hypothetical protein
LWQTEHLPHIGVVFGNRRKQALPAGCAEIPQSQTPQPVLEVSFPLISLVVFISARAKELFRHRQINSFNELGYRSCRLGGLQPRVDRLQLLPG